MTPPEICTWSCCSAMWHPWDAPLLRTHSLANPFQFPRWNLDTWASRPKHFTWGGAKMGLEGGWAAGLGSHTCQVNIALLSRTGSVSLDLSALPSASIDGRMTASPDTQHHCPWTQDLPLGLSTRNLYSFGKTYFSLGHYVIRSSGHVSFFYLLLEHSAFPHKFTSSWHCAVPTKLRPYLMFPALNFPLLKHPVYTSLAECAYFCTSPPILFGQGWIEEKRSSSTIQWAQGSPTHIPASVFCKSMNQ